MSDFKYVEIEFSYALRLWADAIENNTNLYPWIKDGHKYRQAFGVSIAKQQYYKRVEVKEKTIEAWAAIDPKGFLIETSFDELEILDQYGMKVDRYGWKIVKLTGTCKE